MIDAKIFLVIDHQLSKQINFSYFAAVKFHGMIKSDLERFLWRYPLSNKASLAKFCLVFQFSLLCYLPSH